MNGVFDILHPGHARFLDVAHRIANGMRLHLVVAVNTDASVKALDKGSCRPVNPLEYRMEMLAALDSVDYVIPFKEPNASSVLKKLKPRLYIKGAEYADTNYPELPTVKELGTQVVFLPVEEGYSTTLVLNRIWGREPGGDSCSKIESNE